MRDMPEPFNAERLLALMQTHAQRNEITLPDGATEALNLAYQVSMHVEEGRPLLIAFVLRGEGQKLNGELLLSPPVHDFEGLRRIAPGAGRDWLCARFGRDHEGEWSVLSVAPRQELPKTTWRDRFWGHMVFVETAGPGCVALKINDHQVRYERGRYVTYDPIGSIRAIIPSFIPDAMAEPLLRPFAERHWGGERPYLSVDENAYAQHYEAFAEEVRSASRVVAGDGVYFIAEYANRLRHGGTLLIVQSAKAFLSDPTLVAPRHRLLPAQRDTELWSQAMLETLEWESHRQLARKGMAVLPLLEKYRDSEGLKRWITGPCGRRIDDGLRRWNGSAHRCAELTQMDGVTVFNRILHPVAIGVRILNVTDEMVAKLPGEFHEAALGRGLRHQSAACAVAALPGSLALVVSQDGHVTAFAHSSSGALTHRTIM